MLLDGYTFINVTNTLTLIKSKLRTVLGKLEEEFHCFTLLLVNRSIMVSILRVPVSSKMKQINCNLRFH